MIREIKRQDRRLVGEIDSTFIEIPDVAVAALDDESLSLHLQLFLTRATVDDIDLDGLSRYVFTVEHASGGFGQRPAPVSWLPAGSTN